MAHFKESPVYTAAFHAVLSTAATPSYDIIGILASSLSRVAIHKFEVGAHSTAAVSSENLEVLFLRGSTASSTTTLTPTNVDGFDVKATAQSSVTGPSSNLVSTASAVLVYAKSWEVQYGSVIYEPYEWQDRIRLEAGQRLHIRMAAPSVNTSGFHLVGTLTFSEIGYVPPYTVSPTAHS